MQTLAVGRVRIAAWQMVSCPSDAKGRRYWEESVTWRCDEMKAYNTWTEWLSLTKEFEHSWHVMLNLKPLESPIVCDFPVERSKRPRDDSDPWNVAWPSDTHRRLEVLGDNKVVINWMNGAWEVKGDEHAVPVRGVVDQFVRVVPGRYFPAEN